MTRNHLSERAGLRRMQATRLASLLLLGLSACGGGGDGGIITRVPTCTITGVSVQPTATTLSTGESTLLQALPSSQNCTSIPAVSWTSASPAVATVGASTGQVTAVTPGTAVITASIGSASGTSIITVRIPPVVSIFVAPPSALQVGQALTLTAEPRDAAGRPLTGRAVTWQSNATSIATVDANGRVSGIAPGTATITASCEGINQQVTITVQAPAVVSIQLTVPNTSLLAAQTTQAVAVVQGASGVPLPNETVTWASLNTAVATVTSAGLIRAVAPGQAIVRVTSNTNTSVSAQAVITVSSAPFDVIITLVSTLNVTQSATATAVVRDAGQNAIPNANVTWTSSNPAVASVVSTTGVVTALSAGTANITATVVGATSITATKAITIAAPVASVNVTQSNVLLEPAPEAALTSQQLTVTLRDALQNVLTGRAITYASSNAAVATVSATGLVSAVAVGTGTITVTSEGVSTSLPLVVARAFAVVEANQPATATYQPIQHNSAGSPITVTRTGTGQYTLTFNGLGVAATTIGRSFAVLVNAANSSINSQLLAPSASCAMSGLNVAGPTIVTVFCIDPVSLALKDAPFRVILIGNNSVGGGTGNSAAFSLRSSTLTTTYTPSATFAWNSAGGAMTITPGFGAPDWNGTQVRHSMGLTFEAQHAVVAPFIATPGQTCLVRGQVGGTLFTDVLCFDRVGPIAASHTVVKLSSGRPGRNGGVAFVDAGTGVNFGQGFNSAGGTVVTSRTGPGRYTIVFGGMVATGALGVMVSPWGTAGWANCSHYVVSTNPVTIDVACFNAFGAFMDAGSAFTLLVLQ